MFSRLFDWSQKSPSQQLPFGLTLVEEAVRMSLVTGSVLLKDEINSLLTTSEKASWKPRKSQHKYDNFKIHN